MADDSIFTRINHGLQTTRIVIGNLLFVLVLVFLAGSLIGSCSGPALDGKSALLLQPAGMLVEESAVGNPLDELLSGAGEQKDVVLGDLIQSIRRAADDERIPLLVLDLAELDGLSPAHAETLEAEITKFRKAGKTVIAWGDWMSQAHYRLASIADEVYMHPMGGVLFEGYGAHGLYFKDLLDRLKVNVHVFRVGEFKSAIEPFTENGMSDAARAANQEVVIGLWNDYSAAVTRNRSLEPGEFEAFVSGIDQRIEAAGGDIARAALEAKLVDELLTHDELNARIVDRVGADHSGDFNAISWEDFLAVTGGPTPIATDANIALIRMTGTIVDVADGSQSITPEAAGAQIRQARDDSRIRAVVVRIDSPGGSAFASELIRKELELVQLAKKPVVVSMGDVAASGGYWIASTADSIYAHPQTVTGSIGVFSILPTMENSLEAIGVHSDGVGTSPLSSSLNPFGALPEPYARIAQASVTRTYTDFLNLVARGRSLPLDEVGRIAEGRVWLGNKAKALGLVNELGGLDAAIAHAAKLAAVENPVVKVIEPERDPRAMFLHELLRSNALQRLISSSGALAAPLHTEVNQRLLELEAMFARPGTAWAFCAICTSVR